VNSSKSLDKEKNKRKKEKVKGNRIIKNKGKLILKCLPKGK